MHVVYRAEGEIPQCVQYLQSSEYAECVQRLQSICRLCGDMQILQCLQRVQSLQNICRVSRVHAHVYARMYSLQNEAFLWQ